MLPVKYRLPRLAAGQVLSSGLSFHSPFLSLKVVKISQNEEENKFLFVVPAKIAKTSVLRHRLKRQLRAIVVKTLPHFSKNGFGVMIFLKKDGVVLPFARLEKELLNLFNQAKLTGQ